jgi:hypothetical protein
MKQASLVDGKLEYQKNEHTKNDKINGKLIFDKYG